MPIISSCSVLSRVLPLVSQSFSIMTAPACSFNKDYAYRTDNAGERKTVQRSRVPEDKVSWSVEFKDYDPPQLTAPHVLTAPWADPQLGQPGFTPTFNQIDGKVDRRSHKGPYKVENGVPLNIQGRTGIAGRGMLGRWGPNHAADPVVTRWKRNSNGDIVRVDGKPELEFVAIQRRDNGQWALPGGMVDPGEAVSVTVRREFMEEALDSGTASNAEKEKMTKQVEAFFSDGHKIFAGPVCDPRDTDNAWMETVAFHFHDETGEKIGKFNLKAGDDAKALMWMEVNSKVNLHAAHGAIIRKAAERVGAHW